MVLPVRVPLEKAGRENLSTATRSTRIAVPPRV